MVMQRWDPFRELRNMDDTMNRLWRGFGGVSAANEDWNIAIDVIQKTNEVVVKASIPGIDPEAAEVIIQLQRNPGALVYEYRQYYSQSAQDHEQFVPP